MNKKLIAAIAATTMAGAVGFASVAAAEATFYGRVVAGAVYNDKDTKGDDGAWNLGATDIDGGGNPHSRFGFKGSTDLGNGMEAGFKIERGIRSDNAISQRHNFAYISGGWGKLTLGNQSNPYMNARNWDQTNLFGGNYGEAYRHEGIGYSMSTGAFSLNILAIGNDGNIDKAGSTDPIIVAKDASKNFAVLVPVNSRVKSSREGAVVAADGSVTCADPCEAPKATEHGGDTGFVDANEVYRAELVVVTDTLAGTNGVVELTDVGLAQQGTAAIEGKYGAPEIKGDSGVDGWIIHVGYDFGAVNLNVAHHADNKDVNLAQYNVPLADTANPTTAELADQSTVDNNRSGLVDAVASRDRTAIGINGTVGPLDWYLAYNTTELNTNNYNNDVDSVGGFLGFSISEADTIYGYYVSHEADRPTYKSGGAIERGKDYTETIVGYSRSFGPGVKFIAEYAKFDEGLEQNGEPNKIFLGIKYDF